MNHPYTPAIPALGKSGRPRGINNSPGVRKREISSGLFLEEQRAEISEYSEL